MNSVNINKYSCLFKKVRLEYIRSCLTTNISSKYSCFASTKLAKIRKFPEHERSNTFQGNSSKILKKFEKYHNQLFCTASDKNRPTQIVQHKDVVRNELKVYIEQNKEKFRNTENRLKQTGTNILQNIKETKNKMKDRVEEIIERENVYTIPNFLCVSRIVLSPFLGYLIVQSNFDIALGVLVLAAVTDLLDGWIARTWKSQSSKIGSFLDPMADKVLIATLFLTLTYADLIPILLTGIIIARDVVLVTAASVIRYKSLPSPKTLSRYFDATLATAQLAPTFMSKVNTAIQLTLVGSTLAAPVFHYIDHPLLQALWYITGSTTIAASISYMVSNNTYHIVKNQTHKPK